MLDGASRSCSAKSKTLDACCRTGAGTLKPLYDFLNDLPD
jgi:hypothetical protein